MINNRDEVCVINYNLEYNGTLYSTPVNQNHMLTS